MERGGDTWTPADVDSVRAWWEDAGVDAIIDEQPRDWLRPAPARSAPPVTTVEASRPSGSIAAAAEAPLPDQLDLFWAYLRDDPALPFAAPAAPRICPEGDAATGVMMMVDMPSGEDCTAGALLSGEAGRLFDRMLAAIGLDRAAIYLAALSCVRPPSGRLAGPPLDRCAALARHHVALARPAKLLLFGDAPARLLVGTSMAEARGRWHAIATPAGDVPALVSLPPAFLLTTPAAKAHAWTDLQIFREGP